jgi:hypothetical protein
LGDQSAFHHGEILDAVSLLCTGAVSLTADAAQTNVVHVGSNRLFAAGDRVRVSDREGATAEAVVASTTGLSEVVLGAPVTGPFLVSSGACVRRTSGSVPQLEWVSKGVLETGVRPPAPRYPCAVVRPTVLRQPRGEGTNRALTQDYLTSVYYVRAQSQGEDEEAGFLAQVGLLFDVLMADPYLGGTCWYSQVVEVDYATAEECQYRSAGNQLRVARLDLVSRRSELGSRG